MDYGTKNVRRVDFMQFEPAGVVHVSDIEKGIFISYEVKSCKADFKSGFGRNFVTEKNYFVMPMALYKEIANEIEHKLRLLSKALAASSLNKGTIAIHKPPFFVRFL